MLVVLQGPERGYKQRVKQLEFSRDGAQLYAGITKYRGKQSSVAEILALKLRGPRNDWRTWLTANTFGKVKFWLFPDGFGAGQLLVHLGYRMCAFDKWGNQIFHYMGFNDAPTTCVAVNVDACSLIECCINDQFVRHDFREEPPTKTEITISKPNWIDWWCFLWHSQSIAIHDSCVAVGLRYGVVVGPIADSCFMPTNTYYHPAYFRWVSFSLDGSKIIGSCGWQVLIWDRIDPKSVEDRQQSEKSAVRLRGHHQLVTDVALLPDGFRIITASLDNTVRIWDMETGEELERYDWGIGAVRSVAVSPDGAVAAAGGDGENQIVIWDLE